MKYIREYICFVHTSIQAAIIIIDADIAMAVDEVPTPDTLFETIRYLYPANSIF